MNSRKNQVNLSEVKKELSAIGITLKKNEGEYRVSFALGKWQGLTKTRAEDTAYYTDDLNDAWNTGLSMFETGFRE